MDSMLCMSIPVCHLLFSNAVMHPLSFSAWIAPCLGSFMVLLALVWVQAKHVYQASCCDGKFDRRWLSCAGLVCVLHMFCFFCCLVARKRWLCVGCFFSSVTLSFCLWRCMRSRVGLSLEHCIGYLLLILVLFSLRMLLGRALQLQCTCSHFFPC